MRNVKTDKPVAKVTPKTSDRKSASERRTAFARLRESLRLKPATGYRIGTITEDDKYGDDPV